MGHTDVRIFRSLRNFHTNRIFYITFFSKISNITFWLYTATTKPTNEIHSNLYFYSECEKLKNSNSRIPNSMKPHSTIQPTFENYFRNSFRHFSTPHRSPVYPSSIISNSLCFKVLWGAWISKKVKGREPYTIFTISQIRFSFQHSTWLSTLLHTGTSLQMISATRLYTSDLPVLFQRSLRLSSVPNEIFRR